MLELRFAHLWALKHTVHSSFRDLRLKIRDRGVPLAIAHFGNDGNSVWIHSEIYIKKRWGTYDKLGLELIGFA